MLALLIMVWKYILYGINNIRGEGGNVEEQRSSMKDDSMLKENPLCVEPQTAG